MATPPQSLTECQVTVSAGYRELCQQPHKGYQSCHLWGHPQAVPAPLDSGPHRSHHSTAAGLALQILCLVRGPQLLLSGIKNA